MIGGRVKTIIYPAPKGRQDVAGGERSEPPDRRENITQAPTGRQTKRLKTPFVVPPSGGRDVFRIPPEGGTTNGWKPVGMYFRIPPEVGTTNGWKQGPRTICRPFGARAKTGLFPGVRLAHPRLRPAAPSGLGFTAGVLRSPPNHAKHIPCFSRWVKVSCNRLSALQRGFPTGLQPLKTANPMLKRIEKPR